VIFHCFED